jgi:hypothetical protein
MSTAPNPWTPGENPPMPERASAVPPPLIVKKPGFAAFLSAFPGLGNVYNGLYVRGLIFFLIVFTMIAIISSGRTDAEAFFGPAIAFFWFFNIIDAYRQAVLINHGYQQDLGLNDLPQRPRPGQGGIAAGVILVLLGVYALLERFVNIQLDWIFDLWPLAAVGLGVWLIWGTIRDRRNPTV